MALHGKQVASISIQSDGISVKAIMSRPFDQEAEGEDFSDALRKLADKVEQHFRHLRFAAGHD